VSGSIYIEVDPASISLETVNLAPIVLSGSQFIAGGTFNSNSPEPVVLATRYGRATI